MCEINNHDQAQSQYDLREIFEAFYLPGMDTDDWWHDAENNTIELHDSDIFRVAEACYAQGILNNEDRWMATIRFGLCDAIFDMITIMQQDGVPLPDDASDAFKTLWYTCERELHARGIAWSVFCDALPYLFYGASEDVLAYMDETVQGDGVLAYEMDMVFTVTEDTITCQFGTGWSDMWITDHAIKHWQDLSASELTDEIKRCFPDYMYHE